MTCVVPQYEVSTQYADAVRPGLVHVLDVRTVLDAPGASCPEPLVRTQYGGEGSGPYVSAQAMTVALLLLHMTIKRRQVSSSTMPISANLCAKPRPCVPLMRAVAMSSSGGRNLDRYRSMFDDDRKIDRYG